MSAWVKVYNSLPSHPKIVRAGDRAAWLFVCGLCYCNEHLTDGWIAAEMLPVLAPGVKSPKKLAQVLVNVGLWKVADGGWQVHGYVERQRSKEQIEKDRAAAAQRKRQERGCHASVTA